MIVGFTDFGQTPLNPDELQGLIPPWITTHAELNLAEQANIIEAEAWCFAPRARREISELFANRLHRRMFAQVWSWAGTYRKSDKNLGCVFYEIPQQMKSLFDEAQFWAAHATYPPDEIAIRLKHRLVSIHAYANGNGRHSRMIGDLAYFQLAGKRFSWGASRRAAGAESEVIRKDYIAALHSADRHDMTRLLAFAHS